MIMAEYKDIEGIREFANRAKLQLAEAQSAAQRVIPVMEIDKRVCNIIRNASATNATSATVYTTPADKDFYLVAANLSYIRDNTATSTSANLTAITEEGAAFSIISLPALTLTAGNMVSSISFPMPIKLMRNTIIQLTNSTNVANISSKASIIGYTIEPN